MVDPRLPLRCSPLVKESFVLKSPAVDVHASESFIHQAMEIIMDEAVKKATDVREKVKASDTHIRGVWIL